MDLSEFGIKMKNAGMGLKFYPSEVAVLMIGFRTLCGPDMDGGELAVCVCMGQRYLHAPHIRRPDLHGAQVTRRGYIWRVQTLTLSLQACV